MTARNPPCRRTRGASRGPAFDNLRLTNGGKHLAASLADGKRTAAHGHNTGHAVRLAHT